MTRDEGTWSKILLDLGVWPEDVPVWAKPFAQHVSEEAFGKGRPELLMWLSQVLHESSSAVTVGGKKRMRRLYNMEENLNYSVQGLLATFGRHRISEADAKRVGRIDGVRPADKKAIANILYGGEWGRKNLGNTQPNDGWDFRGSGLIQTTGRDNFTYLRDTTGVDVVSNPDLLRKAGGAAVTMAIAMWKRRVRPEMIGNLAAVRKAINGGQLGMEDAEYLLALATAKVPAADVA